MTRYLRCAAAALAAWAAPLAAQPDAPPTLVVVVVIDQLLPEYLTRWEGQLTGGLGRLRREGAVFLDGYQDHGLTETAPGHATVLSGRFPRGTGIVRNAAGVQDVHSPLVGGGPAGGASPARFRGSALFDWLRAKDPRSRALSVSYKDRGAILPLGRAREAVFWYAGDGRFTTSTFYADTLPAWLRAFNARGGVRRLAGREWRLLLPDSAYPEPDSVPREGGGAGFTFPHRLPGDSAALVSAVATTPWMDELTLEAALAGAEAMALGRGPATDLLVVSLSATDAIGHRYGPDSRETHDQVLRLDRMLGAFLDSLFATRDPTRVLVAMTADHGVTPFPEVRRPAEAERFYVSRDTFRAWLGAAARRAGVDPAALEFHNGVVFYDPARFRAAGADPAPLMAEFVAYARTRPGVLRADLPEDLVRDSAGDPIARRWARSFPPDAAVGAVVTQRPWHVWGAPGRGSAPHGSVHDHDARVPIIFLGSPFRPGTHRARARTVDVAPTLARVLGLEPAEPLDGRVLTEALRQP